jgi:hypothetical protein
MMSGDTDPEEQSGETQRMYSPEWSDSSPDVPTVSDVLPDGRETVVIGDVDGCKEFNHEQGDNTFGFQSTCGLVSVEDVLRQLGVDVSENDVVSFAVDAGLCGVTSNPSDSGGSSPLAQAMILKTYGVPAHVETLDSFERLADCVEHGHGVIIGVNAGVLWDDPNAYENGQANHAVVVTGVAREPQTSEIQGFFINDSGRGLTEDSGRFICASTMQSGWENLGGASVVTDVVRT